MELPHGRSPWLVGILTEGGCGQKVARRVVGRACRRLQAKGHRHLEQLSKVYIFMNGLLTTLFVLNADDLAVNIQR